MSDQINLVIGAKPWRPSSDSEEVEVYAQYDMPIAGVVSQAGCYFLFECVEGAVTSFSLWVYAPVTDREEAHLSTLTDDKLSESMNEIWASRDVTVAIAVKDTIATGGTLRRPAIERHGFLQAVLEGVHDLLSRDRDIVEALEIPQAS
ncbi:MAG TPA: hypothetical protein VGI74_04145 [Streptosporangiaceae bacterium]|jgi:hypothetical protein